MLKTGNHPAYTIPGLGMQDLWSTGRGWGGGDSEAETEQLTEELRTLPDRVERRQQTGRAGMAGSQKTHLDPTQAG